MQWLLLVIGTIIVVECFILLPVGKYAIRMLTVVRKVAYTIRSPKISDHWKERVLPSYAGQLFKTSILLFAIVCLALSPMLVLSIAADSAGLDFTAFLTSMTGVFASTGIAIVYFSLRNRLR